MLVDPEELYKYIHDDKITTERGLALAAVVLAAVLDDRLNDIDSALGSIAHELHLIALNIHPDAKLFSRDP